MAAVPSQGHLLRPSLPCCSTSDTQYEQTQIIGILDPSLEDIRPSLVGCLHIRGTVQRGRTLQLGDYLARMCKWYVISLLVLHAVRREPVGNLTRYYKTTRHFYLTTIYVLHFGFTCDCMATDIKSTRST